VYRPTISKAMTASHSKASEYNRQCITKNQSIGRVPMGYKIRNRNWPLITAHTQFWLFFKHDNRPDPPV